MLLVVDANILVAEALRERGQALFADATLELLVTDMAWAETQRILRQRIGLLSRRGQINPQSSLQLFAATVSTLLAHIGIAPA